MGDILFLSHRIPFPPDRGDKIRSFNLLKHLSKRHRIHLVAFADDARDLKQKSALTRYTASRSIVWRDQSRFVSVVQSIFQNRPASVTAFSSASARQAIDDVLGRHIIDTIFVFSGQMAQYLPSQPRQRVIMDFVDMDSAKFAAYAQSSRGVTRWMMQREASLLFQFERAVAAKVDASLFVSEAEADLFRTRTGSKAVHVVENGIDTDYFDPQTLFKQIEATEALLVFTGQMDYRPNIEAVEWFVETIFPHVRLQYPKVKFAIVGRNPTDAVKALGKTAGVIVTGEVADVRGWLAAASVVVAPLRLARGVQNKVLEAMAMARPVVASGPAAEGIDHGDTVLIGHTVGGFADSVIGLLRDPDRAMALGKSARQQVKSRYGWSARLAVLDSLLAQPRPTDRKPGAGR